MIRRNDRMLVRIAEADAYAMAAEYVQRHPDEQEYKDLFSFTRYMSHPTHHIKPGHYTDDTQMSIANAEVLLQDGVFTNDSFAEAYVRCFHRDWRDGYSRGFQSVLEKVRTGADLRRELNADSIANGAAMRAVPIGVINDPKMVMHIARMQAEVTHNTYGGITSAQLVALMSHFSLYDERPMSEVGTFLKQMLPDVSFYDTPWTGPVATGDQPNGKQLGMGMLTAHVVYHLLTHETSLMNIMHQVLTWGGDTDSVAAIAWGIASAHAAHDEEPEFMWFNLEPGKKYGPEFLLGLGTALMDKYDHDA